MTNQSTIDKLIEMRLTTMADGSLQAVLQHQVCPYAGFTHGSGHCTS